MMKMKLVILGCCLLGWGEILLAQQSADAAGGNGFGIGGSISYSVGQVDFSLSTGIGGTATQGVQQPFEILSGGISELGLTMNISMYPNPASEELVLQLQAIPEGELWYELLDVTGKKITACNISSDTIKIPVSNYTNGTYFIRIIYNNESVQSFQFIKNK